MTTMPLTAAEQTAALLLGDAALITPTADVPPVTEDGANILALKTKAMSTAMVYGAQHARGEASLTKLAFYFSGGVREGFLSEGDAEGLYKAFIAGHNQTIDRGPNTGHEHMASDATSLKVPTSLFKTFGKRAPVSMGADFYQRVLTVRHTIGPTDRAGSAYNAMVTVNRRVVELGEKAAQVVVTDDDIRGWISKKPVATKDDLAKLEELCVKLAKMVIDQKFIGLGEPVSALETFVAKVKLGQNRPALTLVPMTSGEIASAEKAEEKEERAA